MRLLLIVSLLVVHSAYAQENLQVTARIDGKNKILNISEAGKVIGNTVGYLSTCIRHERVVAQPYDLQSSLKGLETVKLNDHIRIKITEGGSILPLRFENISVDEIYIGFSDNHFPITYTVSGGRPQSYAKCMGDLSIYNFKCDKLISELFNLNSNDPFCKKH